MKYWQLLRAQQWIKNLFVWAGFLFARAWHDAALAQHVGAAFVAFCFVASAVYIGNDWIDRDHDRMHPVKRRRPLASGEVNGVAAACLAGALAVVGAAIGAWAGRPVLGILALYVAMNVAYSLVLKQIVIVDVFVVALGFLLRILAGTVGVGIAPSPWLLMCGLMLTLLLGFGKRRAEQAAGDAVAARAVLAAYSPGLLDRLVTVCVAGTLVAYSLYTISPTTIALHGSTDLVYTIPIVTYALFRYLYRLDAGSAGEDPSGLFLGDRHLQVSAIAWLLAVIAIIR